MIATSSHSQIDVQASSFLPPFCSFFYTNQNQLKFDFLEILILFFQKKIESKNPTMKICAQSSIMSENWALDVRNGLLDIFCNKVSPEYSRRAIFLVSLIIECQPASWTIYPKHKSKGPLSSPISNSRDPHLKEYMFLVVLLNRLSIELQIMVMEQISIEKGVQYKKKKLNICCQEHNSYAAVLV